MTASLRLAELGIVLPQVATPVGAYVPATTYGAVIRTSGQLPLEGGALTATGLVGEAPGCVSVDDAAACARTAALAALAALAEEAGGIDRIARIIRVVGYVASEPGFTGQAQVLNGASGLMLDIFGEAGRHVRSAVGVVSLPLGAPVEIEVEAQLG